MHKGNPILGERLAGKPSECAPDDPLGRLKNSPHELRGDRGENVAVIYVLDDDLLVFFVSVNSYHGT